MAKFTFRLQNFLNVKEQIESQKKNEYGQALQRLEQERERKRVLELELGEMIGLFRQTLSTRIDPNDIRRCNNRIERLKVWLVEQMERIKAAEQFAEQKRLELVEAMKQRQMIETVRERNFEEYRKEEQKAEQKAVDGIVSYRYAEGR